MPLTLTLSPRAGRVNAAHGASKNKKRRGISLLPARGEKVAAAG
ncbi:hypothetical protein J2046_000745 [Rhizobium petrolearium]|nr:hypothetical protein [Neorhizobium petrolearium]